MYSKHATPKIMVEHVDKRQPAMVATPPHKVAQPRSSSRRSNGRNLSWVHGSPRSQNKRAQKGGACCSPSSGQDSPHFLHVPISSNMSSGDPYCTPKHKEVYPADQSCSERHLRMAQMNMQAPKKGGVLLSDDGGSCRKGCHQGYQDADSMSIREFRLETSSSEGDMSTENSSQGAPKDPRQAALDEVRSKWQGFTSSIMGVSVNTNGPLMTASSAAASVNPRAI